MASKTAEIIITVQARVDAKMVRNHYGVPGSPVWYEPENMVLDPRIEIEGIEIDIDSLPDKLQNLIQEMCFSDVGDEHGWEK